MTRKLSEDENLKLIQLYRQHQSLWDIKCKYHRNKQVRLAALESIRRDLNINGMDIPEIKKKIKILRATYYLELDKIEKSIKTGRRAYVSKLIWFDELHSFIKDMTVKRKTLQKVKIKEEVDTEEEHFVTKTAECDIKTYIKIESSSPPHDDACTNEQYIPDIEKYEIEMLDETLMEDDDTPSQVDIDNTRDYETPSWIEYKPPPIPPDMTIKTYYLDCSQLTRSGSKRRRLSHYADVIKDVKNIRSDTIKLEDETHIDVFGKHVAAQLKKLSDEQLAIAQDQIQNILCKRRVADVRAKNKLNFLTSIR